MVSVANSIAKMILVFALWGFVFALPSWAVVDRSVLKKGMTLPEVVQSFGVPDSIEWVNFQGQAILFVFFETPDKGFFQGGPVGGDTITRDNGRTALPLGFMTDQLAGWGKRFYFQFKLSE
jgi:hypothetical protein